MKHNKYQLRVRTRVIVTGNLSEFSQELENLKIYPVEVVAGLLYVGDEKQGADCRILRDLKISAVLSFSHIDTL